LGRVGDEGRIQGLRACRKVSRATDQREMQKNYKELKVKRKAQKWTTIKNKTPFDPRTKKLAMNFKIQGVII
jgi:hypothetical protein